MTEGLLCKIAVYKGLALFLKGIDSVKFTKQFDPSLLDQWTHKVRMLLYYIVVFVFLEFALQLIVYGSVSNIVAHLLFACIAGCLLFLLSSLLPDKINRIIFILFIVLLVVYYEVQFIYYTIFKSFMPVSQIFLGAAAIVNFAPQILFAIKQNFIGFILLLMPIPVSVLLLKQSVETEFSPFQINQVI